MTPGPIVLGDLIAWLRTKPMEGTYNYISNKECLFAQYLTAQGVKVVHVLPLTYAALNDAGDEVNVEIPDAINDIAMGDKNGPAVQTYASALERALYLRDAVVS